MRRKPLRYICEPEEMFHFPNSASANLGGEARIRQALDTFLSVARCPLCRAPLTARLSRSGPYFHCLCPCPQRP